MLLAILLTLLITIMAFSLFMLYRNQVVFNYRIWVLDHSDPDIGKRNDNHDKLPSYDQMWWQLTRFNWDDYLQ